MTNEAYMKGSTNKPVPVEINKGLVLERNTKRVTNLSKNEKIYSQGDGIMKIAPFDNYYLFTIYSELNLEDIPVDIHNMGSFFLTFKDKSSEVRIENFKNTKDINPAMGQILFRISQEEAEKILALDTNIFYITSLLYDDNSKSDETVLYSGRFAEYNDAHLTSLTDEIANLNKQLDDLKAEKVKQETELNKEINELSDALVKLKNEYSSLEKDLKSYKDSYNELCKELQEQQTKVEEETNQEVVEEVNNTLKARGLLEEATKKQDNKLLVKNALQILQQPVIGIKSQVTEFAKTQVIEKEPTIFDTKLSLANIKVKKGIVYIYAFVYTIYADLDTETEINEYNSLVDLYTTTQQMVNENKYNNIEYNIVYNETDYGKLINKYNVNVNCIVVAKDGNLLGKVDINSESTATNILQQVQDIINENNN